MLVKKHHPKAPANVLVSLFYSPVVILLLKKKVTEEVFALVGSCHVMGWCKLAMTIIRRETFVIVFIRY